MSSIQTLRDGIDYVEAELRNIDTEAGDQPLDDDAQARWDEGVAYLDEARAKLAREEQRAAISESLSTRTVQNGDGARAGFNINKSRTASDVIEDRTATGRQLADGLLKAIDERETDDTNVRQLIKRHVVNGDLSEGSRSLGREWAREMLVRATPAYTSAFQKLIVGRDYALTAEERAAVSATTAANGGVMVPTHLDPTVILTSDGSANAVRPISRVVTSIGNSNVWYGVSSAGVTASFDAPQTEVSDDSPTFSAPSVSIHKAQALVQAEVEAFEDIANLADEVLMMFADARDVLEGSVHCTGTGTNQPVGIFTALDANTNVEVESTTAATIGLVDLQGLRRAVPQRFRGRSTWLMNPTWADEIKRLGTALSASYSTDITQSNTDLLLGRPVVETDDAPEVTTTTVADNRIVLGDFRNYVIVDKPGSTMIELVPHLFNTSNNLPDGRRAWYMHWRTGADSVNDLAFRLLQDKTSA